MKPLLDEQQIRRGVTRLAQEVGAFYSGRTLTMIGVLTGSIVLLADLIRQVDVAMRVGVIQAQSYRGAATERGPLEINDSMLLDIRDRDVLLVDDIFDTGQTLFATTERMKAHSPRSLRSLVLLEKLGRRQVDLRPDHVGFQIPDSFVVGYGLDYDGAYRHLQYLAVLEADDMAKG